MTNLITYEELSLLARPCSTDREMAEAIIAEAQREDIRRRVGDAMYLAITQDLPETRLRVLLDGGVTATGEILTGIKTALAYYALARIVRDGNIQATTYGAVIKDDQYSVEAETQERQRQYRELFSIADRYMREVLEYLVCHRTEFPEYRACKTDRSSNRMRIRVIKKI